MELKRNPSVFSSFLAGIIIETLREEILFRRSRLPGWFIAPGLYLLQKGIFHKNQKPNNQKMTLVMTSI
jgi:hypothetical protein